jgi:aminoglycoside phosphotransferase (APT) family kinase protein
MTDARLDLYVLVPHVSGESVLIRTDGARLPGASLVLPEDRPAILTILPWIREALALDTPILETHLRWDQDGQPPEEPIPGLVVMESPPADWSPPPGHAWLPINGFPGDLPDVIAPRLGEWLAELRGEAAMPALRPRWSRPGWYGRASAWMTDQLAAAGRPPTAPPVQVYQWGISALLRAPTATGDVYLKAIFPPFACEPAVSVLLEQRFPGRVPSVLAIEPDEGWILMDDFGRRIVREDGNDADHEAGIRLLAAIQHAMAKQTNDLLAAGCPVRPLASLADDLERTLAEPVALGALDTATERIGATVAWVRDATRDLGDLGLPDTLVHGDFHAGNVALVDDGVLIFDWSDAALGNPIVDLVTWLGEEHEPARRGRSFEAWLAAWADVIDPPTVRAKLDAMLGVGAAYQCVSYVGILRALEPATRYTLSGGLRYFFGRILPAEPA